MPYAAQGGEVAARSQGVSVTILGSTYTVVSDRDEEYIRTLSDYVNRKLEEILRGRTAPLLQTAILTALNIADELFRERALRGELLAEIRRRSERLLASVSEAE